MIKDVFSLIITKFALYANKMCNLRAYGEECFKFTDYPYYFTYKCS